MNKAPVSLLRRLTACLFVCFVAVGLPTQVFARQTPLSVLQTSTQTSDDAVGSLDDVQSAVVQIEAVGTFADPSEGMQRNVPGFGTGFIIDSEGIAVTNNHVVTGGALFRVYVAGEDKPRSARVLGVSECSDLAVIDIQGDGFPFLAWHQGAVKVGLDVYAAGFPLGDPEFTLTRGIVAKANANGETSWASVGKVIQHDATINPGNSGGPLVDENGAVVAINYAGDDQNNQYFAIARDEALPVIEQLRTGINVDSLGINGEAFEAEDGSSGIWVYSVASGSPADATGIKPGDILLSLEGVNVGTGATMEVYCGVVRSHDPTDVLSVSVYRPGSDETLEGQINGRPLSAPAAIVQAEPQSSDAAAASETMTDTNEYVSVTDKAAMIHIETPKEWAETQERPWTVDQKDVGTQLVATSDLKKFFESWDVPGVVFSFSPSLQESMTAEEVLNSVDYSEQCTYVGRTELPEDAYYVGSYDEYKECGGGSTTAWVAAFVPDDGGAMIALEVYAVSAADLAALNHILDTFYIGAGDSAASKANIFDIVDTSGLRYQYDFAEDPAVSVLLPSEWEDRQGGDWLNSDEEKVGLEYSASTDIAGFNDNWNTAGAVIRTATDLTDEVDFDGLLDDFDMSDTCTKGDRIDYSNTIYGISYVGKYDVYTKCGGSKNTYYSAVIASEPVDHAFLVDFVALNDADQEAWDVLLKSIHLGAAADTSASGAQEAVVNPEEFTTIGDVSNLISATVPISWTDIDSGVWKDNGDPIGNYLTAAPDLKKFSGGWETPGMYIGVSSTEADAMDADKMLDSLDLKSDCTYDTRYDYEDDAFVGKYDLWTNCGEIDGSVFAVFALNPVGDSTTAVFMYIHMPHEGDLAVIEPLLNTLTVAPDAGTPVSSEAEAPSAMSEGSTDGTDQATATVNTEILNVRSGPGTNYERIAQLKGGVVVNVVGQVNNCAWLLIEDAGGEQGWVSGGAQFTTLNGDCANIPLAEAPPPPPVASDSTGSSASGGGASSGGASSGGEASGGGASGGGEASGGSGGGNASGLDPSLGCYLFQNRVGPELTITFTNKDTGKSEDFKVPSGGETPHCFAPGNYTYTLDAPPPWSSVNGEMTVTAGDRFLFPIGKNE